MSKLEKLTNGVETNQKYEVKLQKKSLKELKIITSRELRGNTLSRTEK